MPKKSIVIPNQIFIGCPWRTVRPKYVQEIEKLKKKYPISFIIIGRETSQDAKDLLIVIKNKLESSIYAIFDCTSGNANVSLEFGIAEAKDLPRAIYLCTHGAGQKTVRKDTPIIADLTGKIRNDYKTQSQLGNLLQLRCKQQPYTIRFEKFLSKSFKSKKKGAKKRPRALALKLIHSLDDCDSKRREDVVRNLLAGAGGYSGQEINDMIIKLSKSGLIACSAGRYSVITIK